MGLESIRQRDYNCELCIECGNVEKRNCYIFGEEEQDVKVGYELKVNNVILHKKDDRIALDKEGVGKFVMEANEMYPHLQPLELLQRFLPEVCPKSLVSEEINDLLNMESFCRDYHLPPLGSKSYMDYPVWLVEALGLIRSTTERVRMKEYDKMRTTGNK